MPDEDRTIAWIHEQLRRLGCREIMLTVQTGTGTGLFTRGERAITLSLDLAHRSLFPLLTRCGDEIAWKSLELGWEKYR
jgi:hypothetical protein